jgi:hypothetical protein
VSEPCGEHQPSVFQQPHEPSQGRVDHERGFLLLEVANEGVLLEFCAQFKDLNKEIQITPVVELNEAVTIVQKAYKWVDSVS